MTVFDSNFKASFAAPFADTYQLKNSAGDLFDVVGIFDANQVTDRTNGALIRHTVCTLELDGNYIQQLDIKVDSVFVINSKNYRVTAKPFMDSISWARCELVLMAG